VEQPPGTWASQVAKAEEQRIRKDSQVVKQPKPQTSFFQPSDMLIKSQKVFNLKIHVQNN
jgi:hypothetical protein